MSNTDIRALRVFEFNRVLALISDILEKKKEEKLLLEEEAKLKSESEKIKKELKDLDCKLDFDLIELAAQLLGEIAKRTFEINKELKEKSAYIKELTSLITGILESILRGYDLQLTKEEINKSFVKEYVYILTQISIQNEKISIEVIFKERADFAILIYEMFGYEQSELIYSIVSAEHDQDLKPFEAYFEY